MADTCTMAELRAEVHGVRKNVVKLGRLLVKFMKKLDDRDAADQQLPSEVEGSPEL